MRFLYILIACLAAQLSGLAQTVELTDADKKEIKGLARELIQSGLSDLLNNLATSNGEIERKVMIYDSYMPSGNKIFYDGKTVIEDDINPDNTVSKSGPDLLVTKYLEDFKLFYTRGSSYSIKVTGVSVSDVQQKGYPYVLVYYKTQFTNSHRQKATKYMVVDRVAEVRADKPDKQWMVMITRIGFYKAPSATSPPTIAAATAATEQSAVGPTKKTVEMPKSTETAKTTSPVEDASKTHVTQTKPQAAAVTGTVAADEKTKTPVTDLKKTEATEPKKEEPVSQKQTEQPKTDNVSSAQNRKTQTLNAEIASLEKRASKYKSKANLTRIAAVVVVVAAAAAAGVLASGYNDYRSKMNLANREFTAWYVNGNGTGLHYGENFSPLDNYLAKPKSMLEYTSPGIYAAGAGIVVGGVLWFIGSNSNKEAKKLRNQLEQKRKQLSVAPQLSGQQRYAGVLLRYTF